MSQRPALETENDETRSSLYPDVRHDEKFELGSEALESLLEAIPHSCQICLELFAVLLPLKGAKELETSF